MLHTKTSTANLTERQQRIFDFINSTRTGVLASVDPNGEPHATVMYHSISKKDFSVSFLTKKGTKKYDNLMRHAHVVLVVYEPSNQTVAQIIGKAEEVTDAHEINDIASTIFKTSMEASGGKTIPVVKLEAGDYAAFRIAPVQIRMACYEQPGSGGYSHIFESIESFELKAQD